MTTYDLAITGGTVYPVSGPKIEKGTVLLRDGKVVAFIPDPETNPPSTSSAEGVAVDAAGHVYGAEVGQKALKRYERRP